jgi:DEAD/DEAH box helicase domain-containing protein
MNPILLARHVQESLRELVQTTLNSSSHAFEGMVDRFLAEPANFMKGPWISVDMPFRQIEGAADGSWVQPFLEVPLRFAPYQHQMDAFARLSGPELRSTLVATGTGSGKTESYLWPILDHCRRNKDKPGIKAILIYPMNALATDQARRIASALTGIASLHGIRAGIYADAEPANPADEVTTDSIITRRETMRRNPPDILLTNYKMLDYLLLRGRDKPLWDRNSPETLHFLVVDEMHTFDGAQGADLALLLRRLKYRLSTPPGHLICVGSSATLGSGEEAASELRRYAETIFGEPFDSGAVIRETRKTGKEVFVKTEYVDRPAPSDVRQALREAQDLDQPAAAQRLACCLFPERADPDLAFLHEGDPSDTAWRIALGVRLVDHVLCQRALTIISEHAGPASLDAVAAELAQVKFLRDWTAEDHRALAEMVVALVAWARSGSPENPRPLFNVRLQIWIREMARMVADLPRRETGDRPSPVNLFHALDLDSQTLRRMLPVVNCSRCGATAHVGRLNAGTTSCWAPLEQIYEEFFDEGAGNRIRLFYHDSIDRIARVSGGGTQIVKGILNSLSAEFTPSDHDDLKPGAASPVWMYDPVDSDGRIDRTCPGCGQANGLVLFGLRAASLTTGIVGALYSSEHNEESPTAKPRFLMFSDSVQDAAQRAAVVETRNALTVYQKALFTALRSQEAGAMTLEEVIQTLPAAQMDELGPDEFTALFIAREQTWRLAYQDLVREGVSITNSVFLERMRIRLGWEYFVDLSYRAHFSHTLEANGMAVADVPATLLQMPADRLAKRLRNDLPGAPGIDPDILARFLFGVLQRMRRQGSVAHPYVMSAAAASQGTRGLNWFAATAQLNLGRGGTLPFPNPRSGLSPIAVSLQGGPRGFEDITRNRASNWYRDWLFRVLGPSDLRTGTDPDTVFPIVMDTLQANDLIRRENAAEGQNRHAWLLEPAQVSVSTSVTDMICGKCGRREIALSENASLLTGSDCTRIGCDGHLEQTSPTVRPALRRALSSNRNHRVVAREHTGMLEADDRLRVERGFIKGETRWSPNLISATPTLEMGIDIGDLSTLLLSSVPPEEANYVQRMGRSGRRDGNALNLVLANARAHDLQFWEDPSPMLAGQVRPPGVFLAAEEVLLRQVTAFTLDTYVSSTSAGGDYGKVREVLRRRASGATEGFPIEWLNMVSQRGGKLADIFLSGLPPDVQARTDLADRIRGFLTNGDKSMGWRVLAAFDAAAVDRARLVQMRDEATRELERLKKRRAEFTAEEFEKRQQDIVRDRNEINRMIKSGIDDVAVIKFLTDKGVLPNYAFPEEGVKLTSILSRRNDTVRDEDSLLYLEYSRPASSALTEFAPGQYFYANGRQVEIERIEIGKDDLAAWTFCPSCSHASSRIAGQESPNCPSCGDEMWSDSGSNHEIVKLRSVISSNSEEKAVIRDADLRNQRHFDRLLMPFHGAGDIVSSWFTTEEHGAPFGFEFIPHCTFRDFNFGQKSAVPGSLRIAGERRGAQPFRICRYCGSLQKPVRQDGDKGTHPPSCRVAREKDVPRDAWETEVFLMRDFSTEAIRIVIPVVGESNDDDLKSFVAAINLGMRRHFAGKVDHIRSTVFEAQLNGMTKVRSLYLYDSVPGGSGYLRQIGEHPDSMRAVIARAAEALRDCPCNRDTDRNGCYRCVKPYRLQFGPGEPDRDRARQMMEAIQQKWGSLTRTETGINDSIRDALVESALEKRMLQALTGLYGEDALSSQVLPGGRRGFVLRAGRRDAPRFWTIEPQVQIDIKYSGLPKKRIDFLLEPVGATGVLPIVIEMDGLQYHAATVTQDILDRMDMIRSGKVRVWTFGWKDLDADPGSPHNPLAESALAPQDNGRLGKVLANPDFAPLANAVRALQHDTTLGALRRVLDGETDQTMAARSVLLRSLIAMGRSLDDLPRVVALTAEGRQFLQMLPAEALSGHAGAHALDLYLSCTRISPAEWRQNEGDLRVLLRGVLADPGEATAARAAYTDAWRGLWRIVNLFQELRGFHVEIEGLDTLLPPDMTARPEASDGGLNAQAWTEARALCDEAFHSLIDALVAADVRGPDRFGDDLLVRGRVAGMMEFGWSGVKKNVAVSAELHEDTGWTLVAFDPETDQISETVTRILQALEGQET